MRHVLVVQIANICNHATAWCKESSRQHRSALCNHGLLYNHVWMRHCSNWDTVNSTGAFGLDLNYFNFMICTLFQTPWKLSTLQINPQYLFQSVFKKKLSDSEYHEGLLSNIFILRKLTLSLNRSCLEYNKRSHILEQTCKF